MGVKINFNFKETMKKVLGVLFFIVLGAGIFIAYNYFNKPMDREIFLMKTNMGDIKIELFNDTRPITAGNFSKLAKEGFYDGIKFHRVIDGFVIQGGDPLSRDDSNKPFWGTGGPGYTIEDELSGNNENVRGTLSMANAGPNTGGSQFFINLVDNNPLDSRHSVFGRVIDGMDVVDAIAITEVDVLDGHKPFRPMVIESVTLVLE